MANIGVPAVDATADEAAYRQLAPTVGNEAALCRAARHHNWAQSDADVQQWTRSDEASSKSLCRSNIWANARPTAQGSVRYVNHIRRSWLDPRVQQDMDACLHDAARLRELFIHQHTVWTADHRKRNLFWLAELAEVDKRASFAPTTVAAVAQALGLYHMGVLGTEATAGIVRLTYEFSPQFDLFKPDWRHGYPEFYFAVAPAALPHGLARSLVDGRLDCREWVIPLREVEAENLVDVSYQISATEFDASDLPVTYWSGLRAEIIAAKPVAP